jgi:hypothetical protein
MNTEGAANFSSFMAKLIKAETSEGHGATTDGNGASIEWFYRLVVDDNGARLE